MKNPNPLLEWTIPVEDITVFEVVNQGDFGSVCR